MATNTNHGDQADRSSSWPYMAEEGRIFYLAERTGPDGEGIIQPTVIADIDARITEEAISEDGACWFTLEGKTVQGEVVSARDPLRRVRR